MHVPNNNVQLHDMYHLNIRHCKELEEFGILRAVNHMARLSTFLEPNFANFYFLWKFFSTKQQTK